MARVRHIWGGAPSGQNKQSHLAVHRTTPPLQDKSYAGSDASGARCGPYMPEVGSCLGSQGSQSSTGPVNDTHMKGNTEAQRGQWRPRARDCADHCCRSQGSSVVPHRGPNSCHWDLLLLQMESPVPCPMLSQLWPWHCHTNGGLHAA